MGETLFLERIFKAKNKLNLIIFNKSNKIWKKDFSYALLFVHFHFKLFHLTFTN